MEIPHLTESFKKFKNYSPKLAVIIVKKRISAKFFEKNLSNVPPGSVIDKHIVPSNAYSFYLVAQSVTQGSATPTHYQVLVDNTGLTADHLQMLTYSNYSLFFKKKSLFVESL